MDKENNKLLIKKIKKIKTFLYTNMGEFELITYVFRNVKDSNYRKILKRLIKILYNAIDELNIILEKVE